MVEVIETGTVESYDDWRAGHACKKCEAVFRIAAPDLRSFHCFGTHFRHDYVGFKCTMCGAIQQVIGVPYPIKERVIAENVSVFDGDDYSVY